MVAILAQFEFSHPASLLALLVVPLLAFFAYRTATIVPVWQRIGSAVCRTLIVVLLVVACAGISHRGPTEQQFVVFVTDASRSVSGSSREAAERFVADASANRGDHKAAFVSFAAKPGKVRVGRAEGEDDLDPLASNPADAILLAAGSIPPDFVPKIVLLTDGRQNAGDLLGTAQALQVPILVKPLGSFLEPEVCVDDVRVPAHARPVEPLSVEVIVTANHQGKGTVELYRYGQLFKKRQIETRLGETSVHFPTSIDRQPRVTFEARLVGFTDTLAENNRCRAIVQGTRPPQVLLADNDRGSGRQLAEIMIGRGFDVSLVSSDNAPTGNGSLDGYDLVILSNVSAAWLKKGSGTVAGTAQRVLSTTVPDPFFSHAELQQFVHDRGGGLVVIGGKKVFAPDVYQRTDLEHLLPVKALQRREEKQRVLAMVLVIDKSQSMKEERRLQLAKVAAKRTVELLTPEDKVGVIAFGTDSQWISEIYPCSDKPELFRRIDTLKARGVTNMYPALERAYLALEQTDADRRHVILLTDGVPSPGDYDRLAATMARSRITVSTVSVGQGADQTILKDIALIAGGRHHHCDDPADVPKILERETRRAAEPAEAVEFRPSVLHALPGLDVQAAPALAGYAPTSPKPGAELLLTTPEGDPLLAWWRYGAGVTAAITADVRSKWQSWPGYPRFWDRLARHAMRESNVSDVDVRVARTGRRATVTVDAVQRNAEFVNGAQATLALSQPDGKPRKFDVPQVAAGRYQTSLDLDGPESYELEITLAHQGRVLHSETRSLVIDWSEELRLGPADEPLLRSVARITGGTYDPEPEAVFAADGRRADRVTVIWTYLVLAAAVLLVLDVFLQRIRFNSPFNP